MACIDEYVGLSLLSAECRAIRCVRCDPADAGGQTCAECDDGFFVNDQDKCQG